MARPPRILRFVVSSALVTPALLATGCPSETKPHANPGPEVKSSAPATTPHVNTGPEEKEPHVNTGPEEEEPHVNTGPEADEPHANPGPEDDPGK